VSSLSLKEKMKKKFATLKLDPRLIKNLEDLEFHEMTAIQEKALPYVLNEGDVIAQAKTGSGKTVTFGLGILNKINFQEKMPQSLILCPTRELAEQVAVEIRNLARSIPNIKILTLTGGQSEYQQERSLDHGAHILVGTPGRVLKFLLKKILDCDKITSFVLDEADKMLDMGFIDDILEISSFIPRQRQTLLFSATFPRDIQELSDEIQTKAKSISVDVTHNEGAIKEGFIKLESHKLKINALLEILSAYQPERFIVFCKTKRISDQVAVDLARRGIVISSIHGDLEQNERTAVLTRFSNRSLSGLAATDVAARGIDIKGLDLVVNFDLPNDPEVYTHRIGRTGRAGNAGQAVSLLVNLEIENFERILEYQGSDHSLIEIDSLEINEEYLQKPPMVTLYISGGKRDKLRPGDIVGAIVGEAGINSNAIGDISIMNVTSYVAIDSNLAQIVCDKLNLGKIKNRKFKVGVVD
jgi:ATP-independent RNA helicase DbpA